MTQQAAVALILIQQNVRRIVARFHDPDCRQPHEDTVESEINDTICQLINIRQESTLVDVGSDHY